jgi:hypothetical protein
VAAIPEWAGNKNYLLKSTSTITKVSYDKAGYVIYSTFDDSGVDKLKLTKKPVSIKVDGADIKSYVWDSTTNVLVINRSTGKNIEINLENTTQVNTNSTSKIWIYPNPTIGYLNVELDQSLSAGSELEVFDYRGRILIHKSLEEGVKHNLSLTHLPGGMYIIRIKNKNKNYYQKVVIQ